MPKREKLKISDLEHINQLMSENLVDALWVLDAATLTCEYITPTTEKLTGYTRKEIIGTRLENRLPPNTFRKVKGALDAAQGDFETGGRPIRTMALELYHRDGGTRWVEVRAKFIRDESGVPKILGISRDITETKAHENRQEELIRELKAAVAEKNKLLEEIKMLEKLLPICSGCKRIRDSQDRWWPLEAYIKEHADVDFTHTICPDCKDIFYGDL